MSSSTKNLSTYDENNIPDANGMSIGVVVSEWNHQITHALYEACLQTLEKHGVQSDDIHSAQVPGAFELPAGAKMLASSAKLDAVICLGCVIKGETNHNEYINQAVATGLCNLSIVSGKPFIFGVLTPNNEAQAQDRAGGQHGNKGVEAAVTAIRMVHLKKQLTKVEGKIGF
ncbi:MAG: 6,7-dimethyl-8-ribityllumazine synthase [Bacteroidota bacterium]